MMGHQSFCAFIFGAGLIPLFIIIFGPSPMIVKVFCSLTIIITLSAMTWILYLISYNRLSPLINHINPENEIVWIRVTKNNMLTFQVVKKGVYGQTKGVIHNKKADVIDKGDFTVNCINGNKAILVHDMMSHNINLKHCIAWKRIFNVFKIKKGKEAYYKAKNISNSSKSELKTIDIDKKIDEVISNV